MEARSRKKHKPWVPTKEMILERQALELAEILRGDAETYFGGRLLLLRMSLGMSPEALAADCDLDANSWRNWENGVLPRHLTEVIEAIIEATDVDRDWLTWGDANHRYPEQTSLPILIDVA